MSALLRLAEGVTKIVGAACEPEIADCANLLEQDGRPDHRCMARRQITIEGVERLHGLRTHR